MQQFTIQSEKIRDKLNNLLPSQNVGGIGVELTGSTQVIPIVDLTEVAEGSNLRQDLQNSLSLTSCSSFDVSNTTTTIINTTGYFRIFGVFHCFSINDVEFILTDGTTSKIIYKIIQDTNDNAISPFDFVVFCKAGDSVQAKSGTANGSLSGATRQIADLSGNLVNPL